MDKIFWVDTETTGLDNKKHAIIELGGIIEIGGVVKETIEINFQPPKGSVISPEALNKNKKTVKEILSYPPVEIGISKLKKTLSTYIDKYDPTDKFVVAGYNPSFDVGFLRQAFVQCGDKFYGSWFFNAPMDIWGFVALFVLKTSLRLPNYKLITVCKHFGVKLSEKDAHGAVADINATRSLFRQIMRRFCELGFEDVFATSMATPQFSAIKKRITDVSKN